MKITTVYKRTTAAAPYLWSCVLFRWDLFSGARRTTLKVSPHLDLRDREEPLGPLKSTAPFCANCAPTQLRWGIPPAATWADTATRNGTVTCALFTDIEMFPPHVSVVVLQAYGFKLISTDTCVLLWSVIERNYFFFLSLKTFVLLPSSGCARPHSNFLQSLVISFFSHKWNVFLWFGASNGRRRAWRQDEPSVFDVTMHELSCTLDKQEDNQEIRDACFLSPSLCQPHWRRNKCDTVQKKKRYRNRGNKEKDQ